MMPTMQKILARFDGDVWKAIDYCRTLARTYPQLRDEYTEYTDKLMSQARGDQ
jgi:hypothetical protein